VIYSRRMVADEQRRERILNRYPWHPSTPLHSVLKRLLVHRLIPIGSEHISSLALIWFLVLQMSLQLISDRYYNRRDSRLWLVWWTGFKGSTTLRTLTYICYLSACFNVFGRFWFQEWFFTPACSMPSDLF
jgi:hypothetical protein